MKFFGPLNLFLIFLFLHFSAIAQNDSIPVNRRVIHGSLENGLQYFIVKNRLPEKSAELRLAVLTGSLNEEEDQRGLAHFTEHMLFNGTENFPGNKVIDFLELLGIKFGPEINAYTSTEETVYMLTVPTTRPEILDSSFLILSDWAFHASFDSLEIEKERGVVLEEMRMGKGAAGRVRDQQFPVIFHGSKYAERLPIGVEEVLKNFKHQTLKDYYKKWYRPERMAVVAVGDFNTSEVLGYINKYFNTKGEKNEKFERIVYPVPDHDERIYSIVSDPEVTSSSVVLVQKLPVLKANTVTDYRKAIMHKIFSNIFNERMYDLSKQPETPFINGGGYSTSLAYDKGAYVFYTSPKENKIDESFMSLLTERNRIKKNGFTQAEFDRSIASLTAGMENYLKEKDNQYSDNITSALIDQFVSDEIYSDIEIGYSIFYQILPSISLQDVNNLANELITDSNLVVLVTYPKKDGIIDPNQQVLDAMFTISKSADLSQKDETNPDRPLLKEEPAPGVIVSEEIVGPFGTKLLTLGNGARVYLTKTTLKQDEVLLYAMSYGGTSLVELEDLVSANYATDITEEAGLGDFTATELSKKLNGKILSLSTAVNENSEIMTGSSSVNDLEDFFRLIYLFFTSPRYDEQNAALYLEKLKDYLQNDGLRPESVFNDSITVAIYERNPRKAPMSMSLLNKISSKKAYEIFRERFASASDFSFVFVGNFDDSKIREYIKKYIASQPQGKSENWIDRGVRFSKKPVEMTVKKGIENKAEVFLAYTGEYEWNKRNMILMNMIEKVLDIKINEVIREQLGGSYSISVYNNYVKYPAPEYSFAIDFNCDPNRVDELVTELNNLLKELKNSFKVDTLLTKVKEILLKEREEVLKQNRSILQLISSYIFNGTDLNSFYEGEGIIKETTAEDIRKALNRFLPNEPLFKFYLMPEN
ncbi:MAG: insulinase family protein [Ignavibacteriales bacterium]|nr:MAG: insulinase family protein [Ignavibacteriaceae bacterium]MBW7872333.1 insulinase family protein [Ignavibacteria bacterium]MCZ2142616.1 insulinase family protein [Ignavibacteriales bacterium]OQY74578.1 MAG: hypothetical protein B6D45_06735 [Ignavibacteriales bacterium UTCHB3]MBV6445520.1 hypothetical protein [Ignavibacteriaceae bacterium]